jgi:Uma2 family endonuclease
MTMSSRARRLLTPAEYLTLEREAEFKSEYVAGEVFALAGASKQHNLIVANMIRLLGNQLLERDCNVYPSDMRVKIPAISKYTYPDLVVTCGEEQFEDEQNDTLLNPVVIIEVLSESTEAYDRGKKFEHYQHLDTLREYLLVSQEPYRIEQYTWQNENTWTYAAYHRPEDVGQLRSIGCEILLKDIYTKLVSPNP